MKRKIFRIIIILIAVVLIIVLAIRLYLNKVMEKSLPDYNEDIELTDLKGEVTIYRDQYAIPHIYATNETDLYKVTGYIMAQDRLWQMDLLRRVTQGRLAEIFPEEMLDVDILFRSLRINEKSLQILDSSKRETVECLKAFADGVNQYIEQNANNLPVEFKILGYKPDKWEPVHSINLIGYMAWSLKAGWANLFLEELKNSIGDQKMMELLPNVTTQKEIIFPSGQSDTKNNYISILEIFDLIKKYHFEGFNASNNWAINGSKSQSGKPILANDMHLDYNLPGTWYQMHQVVEGQLNVTGVVLPGQPLVIAGHNEHIAWGMTNTYVDNLDFYVEKINPENKDQYEFNGEWKDLILKNEIFKNKKGNEIKKVIRYSHRGPVISDFKKNVNQILSMQWIGSYYSNELEAVYKLNRAENWENFKDAAKGFVTVSQNINYADVSGNIGLYCCAGVPVRNRGITFGFLPGWTDEYDWKGLLPFEKLPFQYNPDNGCVSSANNRTVDDSYPHYIGAWYALQYRIERIREILESKNNFAPGDFMQLQTDNISKLTEEYVPRIIQFLEEKKSELTKQEFICFENLKVWDYSYDLNSNVSLLFEQTYIQILTNLLKDEMGEKLFTAYLSRTELPKYAMENAFKQKVFSWCDDSNTSDKEENLADIVVRSFKEAVHIVSKQQGSKMSKWSWSKKHTLTLKHTLGKVNLLNLMLNLNRGPYPVDGSWHTITHYSYNLSEPFDIYHGASQRHIYDLSNWDNSVSVMPTGNSGNASSLHYTDQTELYINNKYHEDLFSKEKIIEKAKYVTRVIKME